MWTLFFDLTVIFKKEVEDDENEGGKGRFAEYDGDPCPRRGFGCPRRGDSREGCGAVASPASAESDKERR
jgi:hypothetical protein